jgi:hypothetical protein
MRLLEKSSAAALGSPGATQIRFAFDNTGNSEPENQEPESHERFSRTVT